MSDSLDWGISHYQSMLWTQVLASGNLLVTFLLSVSHETCLALQMVLDDAVHTCGCQPLTVGGMITVAWADRIQTSQGDCFLLLCYILSNMGLCLCSLSSPRLCAASHCACKIHLNYPLWGNSGNLAIQIYKWFNKSFFNIFNLISQKLFLLGVCMCRVMDWHPTPLKPPTHG